MTGSFSCSTRLHIESSRAQIEASKPAVAIWCCSVSVIRLMVANGTCATWAATSTSAIRSARGGSRSTWYRSISSTRSVSLVGCMTVLFSPVFHVPSGTA